MGHAADGRTRASTPPPRDGRDKPAVWAAPCRPAGDAAGPAIAYPTHAPCGYDELLPLILAAIPPGPFVVVGESFSGPLAVMLAARRPPGLRGLVLCASFVQFPLQVPERWRTMVRPWVFRWQPLWILSCVMLGRHGFGRLARMFRGAVGAGRAGPRPLFGGGGRA